jgi:hypothetical protein
MGRQWLAACVIVFVAGACGSDEKAPAPAAVVVAPTEAPSGPVYPTIDGVPDLDRAVVDAASHRKARSHNGAALKHHKKKRWDDAIEEYTLGLEENPGHVLMRFNLGCAYALNGDRENALKILEQFSLADGCTDCVGRLVKATKDTDYKSLWEDPDFIELTAGASTVKVNYKATARRFLKNMNKAYWALMKKTVDSGRTFAVNGKKSEIGNLLIEDGSALARWKIKLGGKEAQMGPHMDDLSRIVCKGSCCTYKFDSNDMYERVADIKSVCFEAVSPKEVYLRRIKVSDPVF